DRRATGPVDVRPDGCDHMASFQRDEELRVDPPTVRLRGSKAKHEARPLGCDRVERRRGADEGDLQVLSLAGYRRRNDAMELTDEHMYAFARQPCRCIDPSRRTPSRVYDLQLDSFPRRP